MTHENQTLHDLLEQAPAEVVIAEARKVGMKISKPHHRFKKSKQRLSYRTDIFGNAAQWTELKQRILEKPCTTEE